MTKVFSNKNSIFCIIRSNNLIKLVMKNCLTSIEDCEWTKKELELICSPNQVKSLLSYSGTPFFHRYLPHSKFLI